MKKRGSALSFGPGAPSLILIFVILSMTVLGMLAMLSAKNDLSLSKRSIQVVQAQYALNIQAEECHAEIDRIIAECRESAGTRDELLGMLSERLPEDVRLDRDDDNQFDTISYTVSDGTRTIRCKLLVHDPEYETRTEWMLHSLTSVTGDDTSWN